MRSVPRSRQTDPTFEAQSSGAIWRVVAAVVLPVLVVYVCLYVSTTLARPLSDMGRPWYVSLQFVTSAALCLAPLAVWPFRARSYALLGGLTLTVLALLNLVHVFEYSQLVTIGAIDAVVNTSGREAGEFLAGRLSSVIPATLAAVVLMASAVGAAGRVPRETSVPPRVRGGAALLGVLGLATLALYPMRLFPVSTVKNAAEYVGYRARFEAARDARTGHSFGATTATADTSADPVVVLIVGESLRREQLGLYGYDRPTTPWLSASPDIVAFADAVTAAPVTQPAVTMMMTAAEPATVQDHAEQSWLTMAREVGYDTVWLSNQDRTDGTATALIAEDADRVVYTSHSWDAAGQYDQDLLPELDRVLAERAGPTAIVIHLMGSHDDYAQRYPAAFARFGEGSDRPASHQALDPLQRRMVDYYDNTVLYTDWVVGQIFDRVGNASAVGVGVFVSDHGENLYDTPEQLRGHGVPGTTAHEAEVPFVLWTTPGLRALRPDVLRVADRNRQRPVSTADLFYGLADLIHASWPGERPDRSVFSSDYVPAARHLLTPDLEVVTVESLYQSEPLATEQASR